MVGNQRLNPSRARGVWLLAAACSAIACGGRQGGAADPVLSATDRLQGSWSVQSFTPEAQLEAPLQGLLNAQLGALTVNFSGDNYTARGPAVDVTGHYKIWSAGNDMFSGTLYDSTNVAYRVSGQFQGLTLEFRSFDAPWRGQGRLKRAQ